MLKLFPSPRRLGVALCLLPLLVACGGAAKMSDAAMEAAPPAPADVAGVAGIAQAPAPTMPVSGGGAMSSPAAPGDAKSPAPANAKTAPGERAKTPQALVVFTGDLSLSVAEDRVAGALDAAVLAAEEAGGHLAGRGNDFVKVKVPSASFRESMTKMEKIGEVTNRSVTADDVTAEFKDLEVRLENLKATRKRIEEFMARAQNLNELFVVEKELERVTTEIDVIQGRLRFLRESTSFSVITVRAVAKPKPVLAKGPVTPEKQPPPPARTIDLPVSWLGGLGIDELLRL
ncbi:MAG: DUF4349 domain-containing protein [Polyangiaceae bacterium]|nr:DUF4349 domain-containing protein [Polyangiaceae bacterium]